MGEVQYLGETLWIHQLGHFLLVLSFAMSALAVYAYLKDTLHLRNHEDSSNWKGIGRTAFTIHGVAMLAVIAMIFYAMGAKMFEYYYVFQHVNTALSQQYIFSAFWEGQEGSFMLWMFWHIILGFIIMAKAGKWESPVIFTIALAQFLINIMLLGIHIEIGDFVTKIGINPLVLLRQAIDAPIFSNADYLSLIEGNGLNPLLQNYWNTIHPPVLFLGFASVIIPFGFALGGLITGKHKEWLQPAMKWSLFSAFIFGVGILMGSAWAYEALTFGGFWAWDPVENSSFVPWLALVAGVHTHLIAKNTGYSIRSTYFLYILSFVLVLYSTFLTRSGVLGDTSVHSFTEMGLETQLLILVGIFTLLGFGLFIAKFKKIPEPKREESIYSREFWMFIGALVLLFSAILIIGATSLPVFNKLVNYFSPGYEGLVIQDPMEHYNKYQIWIGVFVSVLAGSTVFLRYRAQPLKGQALNKFIKRIVISLIGAIVAYALLVQWIDLGFFQYRILAIACFFTVFSNLGYILRSFKTDMRMAAAGMSHLGFGLMIIGVLASGLNQSYISQDPFGQAGVVPEENLNEMVLLYEDFPLFLNGYWVEYNGDTLIDRERYFDVDFTRVDPSNKILDKFNLQPSVLLSNDRTKVNAQIPSTKHYLSKDIFTDIVGLPPYKRDVETAQEIEDTLNYVTYFMGIEDTITTEDFSASLKGITFKPKNKNFNPENSDFAVGADIEFWRNGADTSYKIQPVLSLDNALIITIGELVNPLNLKVKINDTLMNEILLPQQELVFESFTIKAGEYIKYKGHEIILTGFNQNPSSRQFSKEEGDIAISAKINIDSKYDIEPIFLIRNDQPMHFKEYVPETGLHIRFVNINPEDEEFTFMVAKEERDPNWKFPIQIAEDAPRNDWIYLRARVFPGINFFWLGSVLMMLGFLVSVIIRTVKKAKSV
jgi:cytochrome c-type biogenesis protein CcmF